jgi:hypothetical protein
MRFPSTLLEFQAQFPDDDHCWTYLRRARWPRGFLCPRCRGKGSHRPYRRLGALHSTQQDGDRPSASQRGHGRHAVDGLPWAHTVFGNLKTWLRRTFHGVSPKHLQCYLDEFVFRFDRRCARRSRHLPSC